MAAAPKCTDLATNPTYGLAGNPIIVSPTSTIVPAGSGHAAYCEVNFTYSSRGYPEYPYAPTPPYNVQQAKIRVGLPLNSTDGGSGGVQGAWNGRTQGLGGGGCVGSVGSVTSATDAGYVGSSTDAGHVGSSCLFAFNGTGPNKLNIGLLEDFIVDSLVAQVRMSKSISETYYGMKPNRNYWNGCSTGGRQGLKLAQDYPDELDGWLVGAPGVNYGRFRLAQIWGQLAMKDLAGETGNLPIPLAKLNQATASAVAFCDDNDGIHDGLLSDPRTCTFSATRNICGTSTAPASNCLTAAEAAAIDKIWDGPRNAYGIKIFPGLPFGATMATLNGTTPQQTATSQIQWEHQNQTFDWHTLTMADYPYEAELGSANPVYQGESVGDIINSMSVALEPVRDAGKKILMWNGTADGSITTHNAMEYYTTAAAHFGHGTPDFSVLQPWFRYFQAPGVGHCGGGDGPQMPSNLFDIMVNWVENGVAPDRIIAGDGVSTGGNYYGTPVPTRTRPLCPFPQTAVYNGSGDPNVAGSFHCGGDEQTKDTICWGLLTPYKEEAENDLQAYGKYNPAACNPNSKVPINKEKGK